MKEVTENITNIGNSSQEEVLPSLRILGAKFISSLDTVAKSK